MRFIRPWAIPFVPFYYLGSLAIKKLYDWGVFKSETYTLPIITVGNISAGGTGKSPFVGYLLHKFQDKMKIATLSRGYGRNSKGFQLVAANSTANHVGDEPLQLKQSFPKITVAVDADRQNGITELQKQQPELIILDDAFQHRKVKAGFQILLTAHYNLYTDDCMLPAGDLREPISAAARADIIIVTKCPDNLSKSEQQKIIKKLKPKSYQRVFFTRIAYAEEVFSSNSKQFLTDFILKEFCLITGIAAPKPLVGFLEKKGANFKHLNFPDHHNFSQKDLKVIAKNDHILTTQKDFMRLQHIENLKEKMFYLPITVEFSDKETDFFEIINGFISRRNK